MTSSKPQCDEFTADEKMIASTKTFVTTMDSIIKNRTNDFSMLHFLD